MKNVHISVQTFGGFDVFVDGELVRFKQKKCKELLAVLVDRRGSSVTRAEAFAYIYGDRMYDRPMQKQFDTIIRSVRETVWWVKKRKYKWKKLCSGYIIEMKHLIF